MIPIAYLIGQFPSATEHAVMEEIASVEPLGVKPIIFADRLSDEPLSPDLEKYQTAVLSFPHAKIVTALLDGSAWRASRPWEVGGGLGVYAPLRRMMLVVQGAQARIIHAQFGHLGMLALPVARELKVPLVVSFRGQDVMLVGRASAERRQELIGAAALVLARSEYMRRELTEMGFPKEKIAVHPSPIRVSAITFRERKLPSSPANATVLMAGRMVPKKGMADGMRAFAACNAKAMLRIAGDGPLREELAKLATALGIANRVRFLGMIPRSELLTEMESAHVFMLPCRTGPDGEEEGIPNVLKEAQASGLPVLSTTHAGIPEAVADGESGFLTPEGDVEALTTRLDELLSHPDKWAAMGRRGRALMEEKFDSATLAPVLMRHYESLITPRTN